MKPKILLAALAALSLTACSEPAEDATENDTTAAENQAATAPTAPTAPAAAAPLPRTESASGAGVFFISPADGDTLSNPVAIKFGAQNMDVVKAGDNAPHSGHHHLIIDADLPDLGQPIPASEHYVHFGDGSNSTVLTLEPGEHTLQLLLGDHLHIPHNPPVKSAPIRITVE